MATFRDLVITHHVILSAAKKLPSHDE